MFNNFINIVLSFGLLLSGIMCISLYSSGFSAKKFKLSSKRSYLFSFLKGAGITAVAADGGRLVLYSTAAMCYTGIMDFRIALVTACGAQMASLSIYFLAMVSNTVLIYSIVGIGGISWFFFSKFHFDKLKTCAFFLFSIGLLLFGMDYLKTSLAFLGSDPHLRSLIQSHANSNIFIFFFGGLLSLLMQASGPIAFMGVGFHQGGIFTTEQTVWFLYGGTCIGSVIRNYIYTYSFNGSSRRLLGIFTHRIFLSALLAIILYFIQIKAGIPLLNSFFNSIHDNVVLEVYGSLFVTDAIVISLILFFMKPVLKLYEKIFPDDKYESISRTVFIKDIEHKPKPEWLKAITLEMNRIADSFFEIVNSYVEKNDYHISKFICTANNAAIEKMIDLHKELFTSPFHSGKQKDIGEFERLVLLHKLNKETGRLVELLNLHKIRNFDTIMDAMIQHVQLVLTGLSEYLSSGRKDSELISMIGESVSETEEREKLLHFDFIKDSAYSYDFKFEFSASYHDFLHYSYEFVHICSRE